MSRKRELIDLAAKAAGIVIQWERRRGREEARQQSEGYCGLWQPLDDDGDALRLAVRIPGLDLQWVIASAWQASDDGDKRREYVRRAIVRAAAEIGKALA